MGEKQGRRDVLAAERWEPYEARVSRTVLRGPGGEIPPGYSLCVLNRRLTRKEVAATLDALSKMGEGPPGAACRSSPQTATSCWGDSALVVSVDGKGAAMTASGEVRGVERK